MNKKGFTLIELLVSLMIIGVLVTASTLGIISRQRQARDSRRLEDLNTITKAIEYYQIDRNTWPGNGDDLGVQLSEKCGKDNSVSHDMYDDLVTNGKYLTEMPSDPIAYDKCASADLNGAGKPSLDNEFFYAWDSSRRGGKCECLGINKFESSWMISQLNSLYPHDTNLLDTETGSNANIGHSLLNNSFNWCYNRSC